MAVITTYQQDEDKADVVEEVGQATGVLWIAGRFIAAILVTTAFLAVIGQHSNTGLVKSKSKAMSLSTYTNDDTTVKFKYTSTKGTPLGIYASETGKYVITSDSKGYVYRSSDYGSSWSKSKALKLSSGSHAKIYGLVMSSSGKEMIAGTGDGPTYKSTDFGKSWSELSDQPCSVLAADSELDNVACVGGFVGSPPPDETYIMLSSDGGKNWKKSSDLPKGLWIGVVANTDFSTVAASLYTGEPYFYTSFDSASSFTASSFSEYENFTYACLAADSSLSHIILTDSITRNVHLSEDFGGFFEQVFAAEVYGLPDSATTTSCAVSQKGNSYALGWTDYPTTTVFDCVSDSVSNCDGDWVKQVDCNSESGDYNTAGLALSQKGQYVFSTDAGTKEISVGKVSVV